ncbi:MAG: HEAT repeat domain-containing protein [Haloarculaceae archaeon]
MSNGDDEAPGDEDAGADETDTVDGEEEAAVEADEAVDAESVAERLDEAEEALDAAETEADLDGVETTLDGIESDLEAADLPEPDEDDEEAEDPRADLEDRVSDLRDRLDGQRGPYAEDVVAAVEDASETVTGTRWTEDGEPEVVDAVERFLGAAAEELDDSFAADGTDDGALADALGEVGEAVEAADLDPDEDDEAIAALLEATGTLSDDLTAAEEWDDLTVREQLDAEGFYDVLEPGNRRDFPPEWNAIKVYEKRGEPEPILKALETLGSDFMEENALDALERMGPEEAFDAVHQRAQKRNKQPVAILGKIGDERATETLHDFIDGDGDPALQKVTLRALGEIGSEESTQPVANRLAADSSEVRSAAARALGLIGDTRAIEPLADVLDGDEADEVRGSAAWALYQIGTERALDVLSEYTDDPAYVVQAEAEKAV